MRDYADSCLNHAKDLYDFADDYKGKYSDSSPEVQNFYNAWSGYNDELVWGARWLFRATNDMFCLNEAQHYYSNSLATIMLDFNQLLLSLLINN